MRRMILAVAMAAVAILFVLEVGMEQLFLTRRQETAPTMAAATAEVPAQAPEPESAPTPPEIYALFGVDTAEGDMGRSDCILLLSLEGNTLRMCSLARDTMVTMPDTGEETKLGHAYAYGGPELAMDTINESFGLNVTKYATVNFTQLPQIVDLMGGAEVSLSREEWDSLDLGGTYLGKKRLNGQEALRYCRLRSIDSDDMRTGRQRKLVAALVTGLRQCPKSKLPELALSGIRMCRTNLSLSEIVRLGRQVLSHREGIRVESMAIPGEAVSAWGGIRSDGVWYYVYDLGRAAEVLGEFFGGSSAQAVAATQ